MLHRATPERLSAFSDGVFAVLITVLVLDLRPPEQPTFKALLSLWPTGLSYASHQPKLCVGLHGAVRHPQEYDTIFTIPVSYLFIAID